MKSSGSSKVSSKATKPAWLSYLIFTSVIVLIGAVCTLYPAIHHTDYIGEVFELFGFALLAPILGFVFYILFELWCKKENWARVSAPYFVLWLVVLPVASFALQFKVEEIVQKQQEAKILNMELVGVEGYTTTSAKEMLDADTYGNTVAYHYDVTLQNNSEIVGENVEVTVQGYDSSGKVIWMDFQRTVTTGGSMHVQGTYDVSNYASIKTDPESREASQKLQPAKLTVSVVNSAKHISKYFETKEIN